MSDYKRMTRREAERIKKQRQKGKYSQDTGYVRLTRSEMEELEKRREEMKRRSYGHAEAAGKFNSGDSSNLNGQFTDIYREKAGRYENHNFMNHAGYSSVTNGKHTDSHNRYDSYIREEYQSHAFREDASIIPGKAPVSSDIQSFNTSDNSNSSLKTKKNDKSNKKRKKSPIRIILSILLVLIIAAAAVLGYAFIKMDKLDYRKVAGITTGESTGDYTNIALFGVDSREGEITSGVNSDTIIIASINNSTGEIKLVSVYRDTYLRVDDYNYGKANSAYCDGGAVQAVNMLNSNLDMDIECFMTVNFSALVSVIDILGGLDIDMTAEEVVWMNGYVAETSEATGVWSETQDDQIWDGVHHLNGIQATSYCRIRYTEGYDFRRTERQRLVLSEIIKKMKHQPWKLNRIMNEVFPQVYTNISSGKLMKLGLLLFRYKLEDTSGFPYNMNPDWYDDYGQSQVVPIGLADNVIQLHEYLFPDQEYYVSEELQQISDDIIWITGEDPDYY